MVAYEMVYTGLHLRSFSEALVAGEVWSTPNEEPCKSIAAMHPWRLALAVPLVLLAWLCACRVRHIARHEVLLAGREVLIAGCGSPLPCQYCSIDICFPFRTEQRLRT